MTEPMITITTLRRRYGLTNQLITRLPEPEQRANPHNPKRPSRVWPQHVIDTAITHDPQIAATIRHAQAKRDLEVTNAIQRITITRLDPTMPADYKTWLPDPLRRLRWRLDVKERSMSLDPRLDGDDTRYSDDQHDRYRAAANRIFNHTYPELKD